MNFKKRLLILFLLLITLFPSIVFAYSDKIILGGENIGIKVNTKYVTVVGFYKVDDRYIGEDAGLKVGDYITKINDKTVNIYIFCLRMKRFERFSTAFVEFSEEFHKLKSVGVDICTKQVDCQVHCMSDDKYYDK